MEKIFFDTNILVYAFDKNAGSRHQQAKALLEPFLTQYKSAIISAQVLHELSYRLYRWGLSDAEVSTAVAPLKYWKIIPNDSSIFEKGLYLKKRYQTSFWDSLILAAAIHSNSEELWSEDFNNGQSYESITIVNPFKSASPEQGSHGIS